MPSLACIIPLGFELAAGAALSSGAIARAGAGSGGTKTNLRDADYTAMWLRGTGTVRGARPKDPPTFTTGSRNMAEASNAAALSRAGRSILH